MTTALLLDTHVWIWWVLEDRRLDGGIADRLNRFPADARPYVADISLWEVAMLVEKGTLTLPISAGKWLEAASHPRTIALIPISATIATEASKVPLAIRAPAGRIVVATSRVIHLPLLTHDATILRSRLAERWVPD